MSGMPAVLLDQVAQQAAQARVLTVVTGDMDKLVEPTVGQRGIEAGAGPFDRVVPERIELFGGSSAAEVNSQSSVPSHSDCHGAPTGSPVNLLVKMWSSANARCLSKPPMVNADAPMRVCRPAASRSSVFHRKVVRSRSSAPTRCSSSDPASGGSHGVSVTQQP